MGRDKYTVLWLDAERTSARVTRHSKTGSTCTEVELVRISDPRFRTWNWCHTKSGIPVGGTPPEVYQESFYHGDGSGLQDMLCGLRLDWMASELRTEVNAERRRRELTEAAEWSDAQPLPAARVVGRWWRRIFRHRSP